MINDAKLPLKEKYLKYYRKLPVQGLAAAHIGRNEDSIIIWRKEDSEFSDLVDDARSAWALEQVEGVRSREWLLERVIKSHFAQRQEVTGADGEPVVFEIKRE